MSLPTETVANAQSTPTYTAGRMYMEYVTSDLACHQHAPDRFHADPFFTDSLELAHAWESLRQAPDSSTNLQYVESLEQHIGSLTATASHETYYADTLNIATTLVGQREAEVTEELQELAYTDAVEYALELRNQIHNHYDEKPYRLLHILGNTTVLALFNRRGFAMPPMPHQVIHFANNPHGGVLLRKGDYTLHAPQRFDTSYTCEGFAEDHAQPSHSARENRLKRVRILSVCCDLRLTGDDGREELFDIVNILDSDLDESASKGDLELLDSISDRLISTLMYDESRKGTRLTRRQIKQLQNTGQWRKRT